MTKAEASRRNGAQSRGPVSSEGKSRSAQNAVKHGLNSKVVVLSNESQEEYDDLLFDLLRYYQPAGAMETDLVHEIAANRWRMRRCLRLETAAFETAMEANPEAILDATFGQNGALRQLNRYEGRLRRSYERAVAELRRLQKEAKSASEQPACSPVQKEPKSYLQIYDQALRLTGSLPPHTAQRREAFQKERLCYPEIK